MNEHDDTYTKRPQRLRKCELKMRKECVLRFLKMLEVEYHPSEAGPPPQTRTE